MKIFSKTDLKSLGNEQWEIIFPKTHLEDLSNEESEITHLKYLRNEEFRIVFIQKYTYYNKYCQQHLLKQYCTGYTLRF